MPLIINSDGVSTIARFILEKDTNLRVDDEDATTVSNADILEISYQPEFVYVSRACGYKSIFNDVGIVLEPGTEAWISDIEVDITKIENENTVHVRIFH